MKLTKILWVVFAFLAIVIGLYPFFYFFVDMSGLFLSTKPSELLTDTIWKSLFHVHIAFGGVALLTGWVQFSERIRIRNLSLHRTLGKIYVVVVLISGLSGVYLAIYSNEGIVTHLGFGLLGIFWLYTTVKGYVTIRNKKITDHKRWMLRSYALCFAAVTLRIWLPLLMLVPVIGGMYAYKIVSWLCWVPNIFFAELIIRKQK